MRTITTYERLTNHIRAWVDGDIRFLAIVGPPGTGKSTAYELLLDDTSANVFKGKTSAISIYMAVHDAPDTHIVFDDVGSILRDQSCLDLMKALCDTGERILKWNTASTLLHDKKKSFVSNAPVLLVCNDRLANKSPDVAAVLDRADAVQFDPPRDEILAKLRTYATDQEILDYFQRTPIMVSLRAYQKALQWKSSKHLDWRQELLAEFGYPNQVVELIRIMTTLPEKERIKAYMKKTGRSRRDYFNSKAKASAFVKGLHLCTGSLDDSNSGSA